MWKKIDVKNQENRPKKVSYVRTHLPYNSIAQFRYMDETAFLF